MIVSLYGPNRDNPQFYAELEERISEVGFENLITGGDCDIQFVISDQLFLDVLLMKIRSKTISYATMKKSVDKKKEKDLQNNIQSLETRIKLTEDEKGKLELN